MAAILFVPIAAPLVAAGIAAIFGWHRWTAVVTALSALAILATGVALAFLTSDEPLVDSHHLLQADALSSTMLLVIGTVATLACLASIGYIDTELADGHTSPKGARLYGLLLPVFLAAMTLSVMAMSIGVMWVGIEATTVVTAFLVGHRRTRAALEATWKYVIICSFGIALAFFGTVLVYFAGTMTEEPGNHALDIDVLLSGAAGLDPRVTSLAAGLLLLGYGAKAGLVPFHTWLADAHSQAPAPVSALMSGVLLSVAFYALLRVKAIIDLTLGEGFMRVGLIVMGLLTLAVAALLLVVQTDFKRMLAYSSMENMGIVAIAAAIGTRLAIAALLLHVLAHGVAKALVFVSSGAIQRAHGSTAIANVGAVLARSPLVGSAFTLGVVVLLGLPPFAMFASEWGIARALAAGGFGWLLGAMLLFVAIAFAGLVRAGSSMMLGAPGASDAPFAPPRAVGAALVLGIGLSVALCFSIGPLTRLLEAAATTLGAGQ
jgi:hydrogenase-4 component F